VQVYIKVTLLLLFANFYSSAQQLSIVTEHLAPFQIVKKNGDISGFSTEIIKAALDKTQYAYTISAFPWTFSYNQVLRDNNTCIYSLAYTPERSKKFIWVGEISRSSISFYSLKAKNISLTNIEDAKVYNVAVIKDDLSHHYLLSKGFEVGKHFNVIDNYDALLKMLERRQGSIDLVILNDELLKNRLKSQKEQNKYKKSFVVDDLELVFYFACNRELSKEVTDKISTAFDEIKSDGSYQEIKNKWQSELD